MSFAVSQITSSTSFEDLKKISKLIKSENIEIKQGQKRPQIGFKCIKRGTSGERKRDG